MNSSECRQLELSDVEQAAQVITQAFVNDPLCSFILPDVRTRVKTLMKFFRLYGQVYINDHCGYGVGFPLSGVAYWLPPAKPDISVGISSLGLLFPLLFTYYPIGFFKAREIIKQTDNLHKKYVSTPHYYLDNIGVIPSERGKGISSRLITPFLKKADAEKVPVYTDTVTKSNVSFYEHFGFQCMEECTISKAGITIWAMYRSLP